MFSLILSLFAFNINSNILTPKISVYLHLEEFNPRYNLLHIGISFNKKNKNLRYDFRAFNDGKSCLTTGLDRYNPEQMFPDLYMYNNKDNEEMKDITDNMDKMLRKDIFWGITNKTFEEIIEFEKTINTKYTLGIYDCRHYVNRFTEWCLDKPTPVWKLYQLWED